ncbi:efflux RND transporter permease subunit, partial [Brucella sp. 21LCYQ03]|nr:efflux RND transporter permease subunit [Brucella sp. 21LCYQ03]
MAGEGEVCGGIVMMLKGGNSSDVIKTVKQKVFEIQQTLPEGIKIEPFLDRTKMVDNAISTVQTNLLEGALIVVLVLVLFLGNFRAGVIVASVIPLSLLFAITMMNIFGVSGNLMSLGALDFGLIVDGAVIIVEAILHHLHFSKKYIGVDRLSQSELNEEVSTSAS